VADKVCNECRRLLDRHRECIEQAHDLRNKISGFERMPERVKMFEVVVTRLESEAAALKQELTAHQKRFHP